MQQLVFGVYIVVVSLVALFDELVLKAYCRMTQISWYL